MGKEIQISITGQGTNISYNLDVLLIAGTSLSPKSDNAFTYKVPFCTGAFRIYVFVKDNKGNVDTASKTISVVE